MPNIVSPPGGNATAAALTDRVLISQGTSDRSATLQHVKDAVLVATGTKSATTFLRGDDTWATPANPTVSATAAPTTGAHVLGEFVRNSAPSEQGSTGAKWLTMGWTCVSAGTPGTWLPNNTFTGN